MNLKIALTVCAAALVTASGASAHHSFAMFDNQKEITLEGTIKEFQWTNPHTWVEVVVKDKTGKEVQWSVEGSSPNNLARRGWSKKSIKAGDKATVVIHPLKNGDAGGSLVRVMINGQLVGDPPSVS